VSPCYRNAHRVVAACLALGSVAAQGAEGDVQWRVSDQGDNALLVIADSDATDNFGSPLFHCKKRSGIATVEGDLTDDLRGTIATKMLRNQEPGILTTPDDPSAIGVEVFTGKTGWRYRFQLSVIGPAFEQLERAGVFQFKLGDSSVRREFKVSLENVRKFQHLCKRPST
jgi:hypothetical protein